MQRRYILCMDVLRVHFRLKETSVWITAEDERHVEAAEDALIEHRRHLESYVKRNPFFLITIERYTYDEREWDEMPDVVRRMVSAANKFNIGPMSAVAGALAELAVERMRDEGASFAIVDNGGDIAILTDREVLVGIYAGDDNPFSGKIAIRIKSGDKIIGVCTSSATVGHSISFGNADAATVVSDGASLADAAATALCNATSDVSSVRRAFNVVRGINGIRGALVIIGDVLAKWGNVEIVRTNNSAPLQ